MNKLILTVVLLGSLGGCAGINYAMEHYSNVDHVTWKASDGTFWWIFDKPDHDKLMITLGLGAAAAVGVQEGLTLGIVDADKPGAIYRDKALEWLAEQGRDCEAKFVFLILKVQWEIEYQCQ